MAQVSLKGTTCTLAGEMPAVGTQVPGFHLADGDLQDRSLADFQGQKLLLNIVPSLETPICAASARRFQELSQQYADVRMVTVSADLPFAQKRVTADDGTENVLKLSTFRSDFPRDYGVRLMDGPMAGLCARAILIVDGDGRVTYTQLVPEISQEPDYDDVERALSS